MPRCVVAQQLYTMFSFCLHLGNCDFEDNESGDGCMITTPESARASLTTFMKVVLVRSVSANERS